MTLQQEHCTNLYALTWDVTIVDSKELFYRIFTIFTIFYVENKQVPGTASFRNIVLTTI